MLNSFSCKFESVHELAHCMLDDYLLNCKENDEVSCIADFETIKMLISSLVMITGGEMELAYADFSPEYSLFADEFNLSIDDEGIWVTPMKYGYDKDYVLFDAKYLYIHEDCNSKILKYCMDDDCAVFDFHFEWEDEDDECIGDCEKCEFNDLAFEDDNCECEESIPWFTFMKSSDGTTSSYSFYSTDIDAVNEMRQLIKDTFR